MRKLNFVFVFVTLNVQLVAQGNFIVGSLIPPPQSMDFLPTLEITINFSNAVDISSLNDIPIPHQLS